MVSRSHLKQTRGEAGPGFGILHISLRQRENLTRIFEFSTFKIMRERLLTVDVPSEDPEENNVLNNRYGGMLLKQIYSENFITN